VSNSVVNNAKTTIFFFMFFSYSESVYKERIKVQGYFKTNSKS